MNSDRNSKFFLQILVTLLSVSQLIAEKNRCNPTICDCSRYSNDYVYQNVISCPQTEPVVRFEVMNYTDETYIKRLGHPFIKAFIKCNTTDQLVFDVISQTDVEYFDSVEYINCPVPLDSSLGAGMTILEELIFDTKTNETMVWKPIHFSGIDNLQRIVFRADELNRLPNGTFVEFRQLKDVNLNMKHPDLDLFPTAQTIHLSGIDGNGFNTDALRTNVDLQSVTFADSQFNHLTAPALNGLVTLKELMFYGNEFVDIDADSLSALVNLEELTISHNKIQVFPNQFFSRNEKLKIISIQSEGISTLPDEFFGNLPELSRVTISFCKSLQTIPHNTFSNSYHIEQINFFGNKISSLPAGLFDKLSALKELNLANNRFKRVSAANINTIPNLDIDLSQNRIRDIAIEDLGIFEQNTTVNLGFNRISRFSGIVHLRQHLNRYNSTVLLRENPFNCSSCDVYHINKERAPEYDDPDDFPTKPFSIDTFALKCAKPKKFVDKSVRHLDLSNYVCNL